MLEAALERCETHLGRILVVTKIGGGARSKGQQGHFLAIVQGESPDHPASD
jgi:hypothetical protein